MKSRASAARIVLGFALSWLGVSSLRAETLEEILERHFAALGGKEKIAAVQTVRMVGTQSFGPQQAGFQMAWKRPNQLRLEFQLQGMTGIQAYDGKQAWMVMPFLGKNDPEAMSEEDTRDFAEQADLVEGPLFNWKEKGHQLELLGRESLEGTEAWKLKLTKKNGDVSILWLEAESYLLIKSSGKRKRGDQEIDFEADFGDYKQVDGLLFAHTIEQKRKGAPAGSTITLERIELNVPIDSSLFEMPAKGVKS